MTKLKWAKKICVLLILNDTTSVKVLEENEIIDKAKNMIFNTFSHELRSPLNGIICSFISIKAMLEILSFEKNT
jgi:signal transduction histidine kinase